MRADARRALVRFGLGLLLGCVAGYAWYHFVGCVDGTCPITSRPLPSTLYGGLLGVLVAGLFSRKTAKKRD